jgi:hypothetical protein
MQLVFHISALGKSTLIWKYGGLSFSQLAILIIYDYMIYIFEVDHFRKINIHQKSDVLAENLRLNVFNLILVKLMFLPVCLGCRKSTSKNYSVSKLPPT